LWLDARTDFRLEKLAGRENVAGGLRIASADAALDQAWARMTGKAPCKPRDISIKGRVCMCQWFGGWHCAIFVRREICETPLAASDYLRLAHDYHTLMIDRIPVMDYAERNAAKRFIALIDTLYDNAVKLMAFGGGRPGVAVSSRPRAMNATSFKRTSSRLIEMSYRILPSRCPHGHKDSVASGSSAGLVET